MQLAMWHYLSQSEAVPANFQLAILCAHFDIPFHVASAHDALEDVSVTVELFQALAFLRQKGISIAA